MFSLWNFEGSVLKGKRLTAYNWSFSKTAFNVECWPEKLDVNAARFRAEKTVFIWQSFKTKYNQT